MTIFKVKKKCYIHSSLIKISWAPISFLIFSNLAEIIDPEYPISFSDLKILKLEGIFICNQISSFLTTCVVSFFPTYGQCKLAPLVGISLNMFLHNRLTLKNLFKISQKNWLTVYKTNLDNSNHATGKNISRQLGDTERLSAAFENNYIRLSVLKCIRK